jgi:CBS domain containing-hemolysin-like protein
MSDHDPLATFRIGSEVSLAQASPWHHAPVTLDSPAMQVMTDLTQVKAATIQPSMSLRDAEKTMIYQGVRMLFVVTAMPEIQGLVTTSDIHGDDAMRLAQERGLRFDELSVGDVMTPRARLDAVDFDAVRHARVGNVIATLQRLGRNHLLVVQAANERNPRRVRGVLSRTQVERQLGQPIVITPIASSFAEIERALI